MGTTSTGGPPKTAREPGTNERRETLRRSVVDSHLVSVDLAFQSGALLLDLSEAGMGVQALSSAPIGNTTSLHFDLPETGGRVEAVGRIAWTDSSGRLGIRFEEIADAGRVHLAQWLSREPRLPVAGGNGSMPAWPPAHMRDEIAALRRDVVTQKLKGDEALAFIVERTRSVTRATGAAIALDDGGNVVCRASSGNAPGVGAHLDPNAGLSGECVRTGEIVRCEDTETDPRADRLVCRKLDLRSIVIVPIKIHGRTSGVLEAFSSRAHAFQSSDVLLLRRVADLVVGITVSQVGLADPTPTGPHAVMASTELEPPEPLPAEPAVALDSPPAEAAPLMMEDILALDYLDFIPQEPKPPLEEIVTAPPPPITARPEPPAEAPISAQATAVVEPPAEKPKEMEWVAAAPQERVAAPFIPQFEPAAPVTEPEIQEAEATQAIPAVEPELPQKPEITPEAASATFERPAVPAPTIPEVSGPAAHSIAAASVPVVEEHRVYSGMSARAATAVARLWPGPVEEIDEAVLPSMTPPEPSRWNMRIAGGVILAGVLVIGGWQIWRAFAPPAGTPMDAELKTDQSAPTPTTPAVTTPAASMAPASATSTRATTPVGPAVKPAARNSTPSPMPDEVVTRMVNPGATKTAEPVSAPPPSEAAKIEEAAPPVIGFISRPVAESPTISNMLRTPVATPSLDNPPAVSKISGGKLVQRVEPVYPRSASGMYGEVTLTAMIGTDGKVKSVKVVNGHNLLAQAAVAAVKRWRYQPFVLNGVPIEVENTIVVRFKGPSQN